MKKKIREYINQLFQEAPRTRRALDLKEEMISNAEEKYDDLLKEGYREEDAYGVVIHSIGDVSELFQELKQEEAADGDAYAYRMMELELQQKKAKLTAISIGMYVFAAAVFFLGACLDSGSMRAFFPFDIALLGLALAIIICIVPTVLLVYASNLFPKGYKSIDRREEEWLSGKQQKDYKALRKAINSIVWTLTLVLYFIISFSSGAWYITWVIFLIAGCVESIVQLVFSMKK